VDREKQLGLWRVVYLLNKDKDVNAIEMERVMRTETEVATEIECKGE
jgi:hypothetical protein